MKKERNKRKTLLRFLFVSVLLCHSAFLFAQQDRVTMNYKDASFAEVIEAFRKQTGVKFLYNVERVRDLRCSELVIQNMPAKEAIPRVLDAFNLTYSMVEDIVVVEEKNRSTREGKMLPIVGKVMTKQGELLPGVSVVLKGTTIGVSSNKDGVFTFMLPERAEYVFECSFIGMKTKEVTYLGSGSLVVVLEEDDAQLEEVVVTGYQTINRRDMVGAFTTIKAEDIMMPVYTSIDQMLQGQVPGMIVVNNTARVGHNPKITIRGQSTILGNTDPLWVVDGIIQDDPLPFDVSSSLTSDLSQMIGNQISWLNPTDIETITVLKDASATAVYGSKASNGVIVITTKRGKTEKLSFRYSANFSFRARPTYDMFDFMNSQERILFSKEAYDAGARYQSEPLPQIYTYEGLMSLLNDRQITEEFYGEQLTKLETVNTDWFKILTRDAFSHNHNLSLSGGSQKVRFTASLGFSQNKGVEIGNNTQSLNFRLSMNTTLRENLRLTLSTSGTFSDNDTYGANLNPLSYATSTSRAIPAYDDEGNNLFYKRYARYTLHGQQREYSYNILNELDNSFGKSKGTRLDISLNFDWKINSWLTYQLVGGIASNATSNEAYAGERTYYVAVNYRGYDYGAVGPNTDLYKAAQLPFGGEFFTSNRRSMNYNMQQKALFAKELGEGHRLNAMLGVELRSADNENRSNTVWGYVPERGEKIIRPPAPSDVIPMDGIVQNLQWGILNGLYNGRWVNTTRTDNYLSMFATLAYSIRNRYVFNFNIRSDASNRFGQDVNKRFDPTYSLGVSWRAGEEEFMKEHLPWMNQFNIRATYGIQGNVVNAMSPELILRQGGVLDVYDQYYVTISNLPNPNLKWERTHTWNIGLDMQLFKAITMGIDYYGRRSNAIVNQDISNEYGRETMQLNGGMINNHGIEFSMNLTPFQRKDFAWTIGLNASKNWNESRSDDALPETLTRSHFLSGSTDRLLKKGYAIGSFWSYSFAGLSPEDGYPTFNRMEFETAYSNIDPTTFLVYSGQKDPYFSGGLNTRIRYKRFNLGANFAVLLGAKKRLSNPYSNFSNGKIPNPENNLPRELNDRWKTAGDEKYTNIPALYTAITGYNMDLPDGGIASMYNMWADSDERVVSASFLRCNQITFSWDLKPEWCAKIGATSLAFSANVNNVFVIASKKFKGFDPELNNSVKPKIFSMGFNIGF